MEDGMNLLPCSNRVLLAPNHIFMQSESFTAPRPRKSGGVFSWPLVAPISQDDSTSMAARPGSERQAIFDSVTRRWGGRTRARIAKFPTDSDRSGKWRQR